MAQREPHPSDADGADGEDSRAAGVSPRATRASSARLSAADTTFPGAGSADGTALSGAETGGAAADRAGHEPADGLDGSEHGEDDLDGEDDVEEDENVSASGTINTGRWTREEHLAFVEGLRLYGREWKRVARLVPTRTVVQIRTHAQKYYQKLAKERGEDSARKAFEGGADISTEMGTARMKAAAARAAAAAAAAAAGGGAGQSGGGVPGGALGAGSAFGRSDSHGPDGRKRGRDSDGAGRRSATTRDFGDDDGEDDGEDDGDGGDGVGRSLRRRRTVRRFENSASWDSGSSMPPPLRIPREARDSGRSSPSSDHDGGQARSSSSRRGETAGGSDYYSFQDSSRPRIVTASRGRRVQVPQRYRAEEVDRSGGTRRRRTSDGDEDDDNDDDRNRGPAYDDDEEAEEEAEEEDEDEDEDEEDEEYDGGRRPGRRATGRRGSGGRGRYDSTIRGEGALGIRQPSHAGFLVDPDGSPPHGGMMTPQFSPTSPSATVPPTPRMMDAAFSLVAAKAMGNLREGKKTPRTVETATWVLEHGYAVAAASLAGLPLPATAAATATSTTTTSTTATSATATSATVTTMPASTAAVTASAPLPGPLAAASAVGTVSGSGPLVATVPPAVSAVPAASMGLPSTTPSVSGAAAPSFVSAGPSLFSHLGHGVGGLGGGPAPSATMTSMGGVLASGFHSMQHPQHPQHPLYAQSHPHPHPNPSAFLLSHSTHTGPSSVPLPSSSSSSSSSLSSSSSASVSSSSSTGMAPWDYAAAHVTAAAGLGSGSGLHRAAHNPTMTVVDGNTVFVSLPPSLGSSGPAVSPTTTTVVTTTATPAPAPGAGGVGPA